MDFAKKRKPESAGRMYIYNLKVLVIFVGIKSTHDTNTRCRK